MMSAKAKSTAAKYWGAVASAYDSRRNETEKRIEEEASLRKILCEHPEGTRLLDIPFGTGYFMPIYRERGFDVTGIDISSDMLSKAATKRLPGDRLISKVGSIFDISEPDNSFDVVVAIRIMNLILATDMKLALRELQRVAKKQIITNIRVWHKESKFRNPQHIAHIESALQGWKIKSSDPIHEQDFRMFVLEPD